MVIKRSSQGEVARLLADLLSEDGVRREAAVARLAIVGPRAVDRLLAALDAAASDDQRVAALRVLERIDDPRGLAVTLGLMTHPSLEVALAAVAAVRPHLSSPESHAANDALDALAALVLDQAQPDAVRAAALDALHDLPVDVVEPLEVRLRDDPSPRLRRLAGAGESPDAPPEPPSLERFADESLPPDPEAVKAAVLESGPHTALNVLHRLVVAIGAREREQADPARRTAWTVARAAAHQVLAARGSRVALYDLREALASGLDPLPLGMLTAIGAIGDASCLEPLLAAATRTENSWQRQHLLDAARQIVVRERITSRHAAARRLLARYPLLGPVFE